MDFTKLRFSIISIIIIVFLLPNLSVFAKEISHKKEITYTVGYAKTSKLKILSLKNATLQIQLYLGGKTVGKLVKKTDDSQAFVISNQYGNFLTVEVISVKGQPEGISCHGASLAGKTNILIDCHPSYGKGHIY